MTMDLYGHLIDASLWEAAKKAGGTTGAPERNPDTRQAHESDEFGGLTCGDAVEPPIGIEPMTYSLRVNRSGRLS
jgi:hypothetical protein